MIVVAEIGQHLVEENATLKEEAQSFRSKVRSNSGLSITTRLLALFPAEPHSSRGGNSSSSFP